MLRREFLGVTGLAPGASTTKTKLTALLQKFVRWRNDSAFLLTCLHPRHIVRAHQQFLLCQIVRA